MKNEEMALLFSEATPYIQKYHGKTMVIKYGGNAMINETLKNAVMNDLVTLTCWGAGGAGARRRPGHQRDAEKSRRGEPFQQRSAGDG